jgi:hypothetical protein
MHQGDIMPEKRAHGQSLALILYGFLLAFLLLSMAACAGQAPAAVATPQVFNIPVKEIDSATRIPFDRDHFSASIDIEGDLLVAGAPHYGYPGDGAGAAYVYRRNSQGEWLQEAELISSDRDDGFQYDQHFGEAVALNGDLIAVGAPGYDDPQAGDNSGAVYIFQQDGDNWVETARLTPTPPLAGARMGSSIAWYADLMAISGSPLAGSISFFQRQANGWRQLPSLAVPAAAEGNPTYALIDLYGDTLALSTLAWEEPASDLDEEARLQLLKTEGIVTLFKRQGGQWLQTFETAPQEASLYKMRPEGPFGLPVSLGGEDGEASLLAVGKPGFFRSGREQGSVLIYERGSRGWQPQAELALAAGETVPGALPFFGSDPGPIFFGAFVNLEGDRLGVVSTFANTAYLFERQDAGWTYQFRMTPGTDGSDDFMRRTVALDGDTFLLGSPGDLGGGNLFVFDLSQ